MLFELFPPELDASTKWSWGSQGPDAAERTRDRLVTWLSDMLKLDAIDVLRGIEGKFGSKYPWLKRPRAHAERAFRRAHWQGFSLRTIARLLDARDYRLVVSEDDVADGILAAFEHYESRLQQQGSSDLEDFWNTPSNQPPSPKDEERISDKLCEVVQRYFADYAVVADREVQVFRRQIPKIVGGQPGSELDVLVTVPASGVVNQSKISLPIEVKRSCNPEAKTGLKEQLVDRYMVETGTNTGVFVVAWLDAPNVTKTHKPVWRSIEEAKLSLYKESERLRKNENVDVRTYVINLSLK